MSEHPDSYYAATRNDHTRYPTLTTSVAADVAIVGGGFTGIATALCMAERGFSVVLLEQNRIGWGASGRNGGQLIGGISGQHTLSQRFGSQYSEQLWQLAWRGNEIVEQRVEHYDIECDLKRGYIDVALKPRHMRGFEDDYRVLEQRGYGDSIELLGPAEVRQVLGSERYIGGLVNMRSGHLHPLNLCLGEAKAAAGLGVQIYERSEVERVIHGPSPILKTARGEVKARHVLLAGNAYQHLEQDKLGGLVFPAGSYIIATEPLSAELAAQINPRDLAVCDPNHVLDYFRLSADKRLLFGGRCNYSGRIPRSISAAILPRMLRIYPQLRDVNIDYEWGGNIAIVVNRVPMLGRVRDNVFYAMGYCGHGVNTSHMAGEVIADAMTGTMGRLDMFERVGHRRMPFGQTFGAQMLALGMLYFRLRDLL